MSALHAAGWIWRSPGSSPCSSSAPRGRGPPCGSREPATSSAGPWVRRGSRSRRWTARRRRPGPAALDLELRRAGLALEDLGAARGGRHVVEREEPIAVADLLREQLAVWDLVARALGASLVVGPDLPGVHVLGDRLRLAQAIGNLIVNALQHGGGRVELSARAGRGCGADRGQRRGPGLPAGIVAQAERREGATRHGHGLAVAASVARRHGGRLAPAPSARGARIGLELPALGIVR